MLIHSASQLLTLQGGPQRGHALGSLGLIENGAVLVRDGMILSVGLSVDLLAAYPDEARLDASGWAVQNTWKSWLPAGASFPPSAGRARPGSKR
jgi:imidazolonepropionase